MSENEKLMEKKREYRKINTIFFFFALYNGEIEWYEGYLDEERAKEALKHWIKSNDGEMELVKGSGVFKKEIIKKPVDIMNEGSYYAFIGILNGDVTEISIFNTEEEANNAFGRFTNGLKIKHCYAKVTGPYWEQKRIPSKINETKYKGSFVIHLDGLLEIGW